MDSNTPNDIETNVDLVSPPPPHFDAEMISQAQPVEPLAPNRSRKFRSRPSGNFLRGRLGLLAVIVVVLLLGAAALGLILGLRDRQQSVAETAVTSEPAEGPSETRATAPPVKTQPATAPPAKATDQPVKTLATSQPVERKQPEPKTVTPPERVRRVRVTLDNIDRALQQPLERPRKVGEIFGGGSSERRARKGESKHRDRGDDN